MQFQIHWINSLKTDSQIWELIRAHVSWWNRMWVNDESAWELVRVHHSCRQARAWVSKRAGTLFNSLTLYLRLIVATFPYDYNAWFCFDLACYPVFSCSYTYAISSQERRDHKNRWQNKVKVCLHFISLIYRNKIFVFHFFILTVLFVLHVILYWSVIQLAFCSSEIRECLACCWALCKSLKMTALRRPTRY